MTNRRVVFVVPVVSTLLVAGMLEKVFLSKVQASATHAFTAIATEMDFRSNSPGVPTDVRTVLYGFRTDGSAVEARLTPDLSNPVRSVYIRKLTDTINRRRLLIEPLSESLVTYPFDERDKGIPTLGTSCDGKRDESLLGFDVFINKVTSGSEDRTITEERWRAPALNCFPLKAIITVTHGASKAVTERVVNHVALGEPASWLFDVPANYAERSPGEMLKEQARRYPDSFHLTEDASADEAYHLANGKAH